jgi:hypothetical protein
MLTISKPLSAGQAQTYHEKEFTAKEQNYWSQRGVIAGEWQGRLAGQFGVAGTVSAEHFAKLSQGQHPQTGEQLVRQAVGDPLNHQPCHALGHSGSYAVAQNAEFVAIVPDLHRQRQRRRPHL